MAIFWIIAFFAGVAGVLQSTLQKKNAETAGLAAAVHISNLMVLVGGLIILSVIMITVQGEFTQTLRMKSEARHWSWWMLLAPGICGLFVIVASPYLILKIGALQLFVAMIFGQIVMSALWDHFVEGLPLNWLRTGGAVLTLFGAIAISASRSE